MEGRDNLREFLRKIHVERIKKKLLSMDKEVEIVIKQPYAVSKDGLIYRVKKLRVKPKELPPSLLEKYASYLANNPDELNKL